MFIIDSLRQVGVESVENNFGMIVIKTVPGGLKGVECEYEHRLIMLSFALLNPPKPLNDVTSSASLGFYSHRAHKVI